MRPELIEAIRQFYQAHRQELFTYALSLTRSSEAAEDAVHTAFWKLLRRRFPPRELRPYVFRSVRNAAIDEIRGNHRSHPHDPVFARDAGLCEGGVEVQDRLEALLGRLSADERECVVLKGLNGLTLKEVAAVRGVSINTAASWYRRGLEKMRETLEEEQLCET